MSLPYFLTMYINTTFESLNSFTTTLPHTTTLINTQVHSYSTTSLPHYTTITIPHHLDAHDHKSKLDCLLIKCVLLPRYLDTPLHKVKKLSVSLPHYLTIPIPWYSLTTIKAVGSGAAGAAWAAPLFWAIWTMNLCILLSQRLKTNELIVYGNAMNVEWTGYGWVLF